MTTYDDAELAATAVMLFFGIPWLLSIAPFMIQGLAGNWAASYTLIEQGKHWVGVCIGALITLILIVGEMLE